MRELEEDRRAIIALYRDERRKRSHRKPDNAAITSLRSLERVASTDLRAADRGIASRPAARALAAEVSPEQKAILEQVKCGALEQAQSVLSGLARKFVDAESALQKHRLAWSVTAAGAVIEKYMALDGKERDGGGRMVSCVERRVHAESLPDLPQRRSAARALSPCGRLFGAVA